MDPMLHLSCNATQPALCLLLLRLKASWPVRDLFLATHASTHTPPRPCTLTPRPAPPLPGPHCLRSVPPSLPQPLSPSRSRSVLPALPPPPILRPTVSPFCPSLPPAGRVMVLWCQRPTGDQGISKQIPKLFFFTHNQRRIMRVWFYFILTKDVGAIIYVCLE